MKKICLFIVLLFISINTFTQNYPSNTVHCIPGGAKVVPVINPETGETWMDRNLGASQQATSSTDSLAYGDLYQWGRFSDGHQCRNSSITRTKASTPIPNNGNSWDGKFILLKENEGYKGDWLNFQNDDLWQGLKGENNPCPNGYRIPTIYEWGAEFKSWPSKYNSPLLKIVRGGFRNCRHGSIDYVGMDGCYWSSTPKLESYAGGLVLYSKYDDNITHFTRAKGCSVRCIRD